MDGWMSGCPIYSLKYLLFSGQNAVCRHRGFAGGIQNTQHRDNNALQKLLLTPFPQRIHCWTVVSECGSVLFWLSRERKQ